MKRKFNIALSLFSCFLLLTLLSACGGNNAHSPAKASPTSSSAESSASAEPVAASSSAASSPANVADADPLANSTGKTLIKSITPEKGGAYHASYAIISKSGTVAIADPFVLWNKDNPLHADIITVSHSHFDHNDSDFVKNTEARKSLMKEETFTVKDITVTSIPANHGGEYISGVSKTDYIYVFEVDGLRIAHFGDFGQPEIAQEQLDKLGHIDVVLTRFSDKPQFGASPDTTIKVIEQLKPKVISPTHYEPETIKDIIEKAKLDDRGEATELAIDRADLDAIEGTAYYMLK
ncbi:MBL fold metallo-hydrolase [Cohnella yongneupensis]|uniref:MBL fold metallo-hydrolase n=1 Tax=Cohnella yongneupensis TaxID=425006 RepID=A0ABW0QZJ6_9BACL